MVNAGMVVLIFLQYQKYASRCAMPGPSCGYSGDANLYAVPIDMGSLLRQRHQYGNGPLWRQFGLPHVLAGFQLLAGLKKMAG
jgi:hypothetical protein